MMPRRTLFALCALLLGVIKAIPNNNDHDFGLGFALSSGYAYVDPVHDTSTAN